MQPISQSIKQRRRATTYHFGCSGSSSKIISYKCFKMYVLQFSGWRIWDRAKWYIFFTKFKWKLSYGTSRMVITQTMVHVSSTYSTNRSCTYWLWIMKFCKITKLLQQLLIALSLQNLKINLLLTPEQDIPWFLFFLNNWLSSVIGILLMK